MKQHTSSLLVGFVIVITVAFVVLCGAVAYVWINGADNSARLTVQQAQLATAVGQIAAAAGQAHAAAATVQQSAAQSCQIQARGLQAQVFLTGSLDEIHKLLALPPSPQSRQQARAAPRGELRRARRILRALNSNLAGYVGIERQQPPTRTC